MRFVAFQHISGLETLWRRSCLGKLRLCWQMKLSPYSASLDLDVSFHIFFIFFYFICKYWIKKKSPSGYELCQSHRVLSFSLKAGWWFLSGSVSGRPPAESKCSSACFTTSKPADARSVASFKPRMVLALCRPKGQTSSSCSRAHAWQNATLSVRSIVDTPESRALKNCFPPGRKKIFFAKLLAAIDTFCSGTCDVSVCSLIRKRLRKPLWSLWIHLSKNNCGGVWIPEGKVFISLFLCPRQTASNSNSDLKYFSLYANSVPRGLDGPYSQVKYRLDLHREALSKKLCSQRV